MLPMPFTVRIARSNRTAKEGGGGSYAGWTCRPMLRSFLRALLLRSPPPPLPGGYHLSEMLFYQAESQTFLDGDRLVHGKQGEVIGPGSGDEATTHLAMMFEGNEKSVEIVLTELSRSPPLALPDAAIKAAARKVAARQAAAHEAAVREAAARDPAAAASASSSDGSASEARVLRSILRRLWKACLSSPSTRRASPGSSR